MMKYCLTLIVLIFSLQQALALRGEDDLPFEKNFTALQGDCQRLFERMKAFDVGAEMRLVGYSRQDSGLKSFEQASGSLDQFLQDPTEKNLILSMALKFGRQNFAPSLENATDFVQGFVRYLQDPHHKRTLLQERDKFLLVVAALSTGASPTIDNESIEKTMQIVDRSLEDFKKHFFSEKAMETDGVALSAISRHMSASLKESDPLLKTLTDRDLTTILDTLGRLKKFLSFSVT
jgi:hypothetical protein